MFVEYDGLKIHYETVGEGKNLVLLHGWGCSMEYFKPIVISLKDSFRITTIDFPGHGLSETPTNEWFVDNYMESLLKVLEEADIHKTHIIAHSLGCRITIKLANKYPHLVDKIIVTGGAGILPKRGFKYYFKVYRYKTFKRLVKVKPLTSTLNFLGYDVDNAVKNAGSEDYRKLSDVMKKTFINLVNEDLTPLLNSIKSSTLLVWGENDTETPIYMAHIMENAIKDSGLVIYNGAGHYAFLERINEFIKVVEYFLKEEKH